MPELAPENLVELRDLRMEFAPRKRLFRAGMANPVRAVDGVSFDIAPRRDAGPRRRIRLRQVDRHPLHPRRLSADRRHHPLSRPKGRKWSTWRR